MTITSTNTRMIHNFSQIPGPQINRSKINLSFGHKTAFNAGYLIPICVLEALPGDTFSMKLHHIARLTTMIRPVMDNMYLETFFFAVPNRILWTETKDASGAMSGNWKRFMGEQTDPGDSTDWLIPQCTQAVGPFGEETIFDYMGLPTDVNQTGAISVNALPLRAYNMIWNEWFRDENLQDSLPVPLGDGPDASSLYALKKRGKRHDYFTSCLPWPQKGTAIEIPIGDSAPVYGTGYPLAFRGQRSSDHAAINTGTMVLTSNDVALSSDAWNGGSPSIVPHGVITPGNGMETGYSTGVVTKAQMGSVNPLYSGLYADLSTATAATVNDLREAVQLQKMLERDARGGTRLTEIIRSHFGIPSDDGRMQRPEYLGGSSSKIAVNPVQQTSASTGTSFMGSLAAYSLSSGSNGIFHKSFTEHCYVIGLANVRVDINYQQGVNRLWFRQTREDFFWPTLENLGEQPVYNREIFFQGGTGTGPTDDGGVFGYQERYAEYKYQPSLITGVLRSTSVQTLDVWHCAEEFGNLPALDAGFIVDKSDQILVRNTIVSEGEAAPQIKADFWFEFIAARPMQVYSMPGLLDHH